MKPSAEEILAIWNVIEDNEPDISTPRLSMMVCEHFKHKIDDSDVAEALLHFEVESMRSPDYLTISITLGNCPDCSKRGFVIGPMGGASINIECANVDCRERFNAAFYSGQVMFCQRIGNGKDGPSWPSEPR